MRTRKAFLNTVVGLLSALITTFLSFFLNRIFLSSLGLDYLGLNGIFSNALGMLSLTELGIGMAISYELYVPLAQNDTKKIAALMNFYKKTYYIIAGITFLLVSLLVFLFALLQKHLKYQLLSVLYIFYSFYVIIAVHICWHIREHF